MMMFNKKILVAVISGLVSGAVNAELAMLEDGALSGISGQSGITMELGLHATVGGLSYFDDGNGIMLEGVEIGSVADITKPGQHTFVIDIAEDSSLNVGYEIESTRLHINDIKLSDDSVRGMGSFEWDYSLNGNLSIKSGGALSSAGYTFNSSVNLTNGRFAYTTNGNSLSFEGISGYVNLPGMTLDLDGSALRLEAPSITGEFNVASIHHNGSSDSYGSLWTKFDQSSLIKLTPGGRYGSNGMMLDINQQNKMSHYGWGDDGNWVGLVGVTGFTNIDNLSIDVAPDSAGRLGLVLAADSIDGAFRIEKFVLGETKANLDAYAAGSNVTLKSIGSIDVDYSFRDQIVNGQNYTNRVFLQGGGNADAGNQGLTLNSEWSLANASVTYTDDGNSVMISGLQSWGKGIVTADVTSQGVIGSTEFFDGLRVGFEDLSGGYKMDGLRVGNKAVENLDDKQLQGGTELLLALGVYPAFDFNVNGHMTIGAGGASGSGLTINSDIYIDDGKAALMVDENGKGLWLTDLKYDIHMRDMTVDVNSEGLLIVEGETWSRMDIGDLRLGGKADGASFGRFVWQRYETGSSMAIKAGGAGGVCVGGAGTSASTCTGSGERWEDRGNEGVTVSLKTVFAEAVDSVKRNRLAWETNRTYTDVNGNSVGMSLVFDNITTNDGDGTGNNTFGMQNDISIDVAETKVVDKNTGAVSNPLGFAVKARTQVKELSVGSVDLVHPEGGSSTILYGLKIQNLDMTSNLTATPIP
ncbi:MAG: hypothetical protein H6999_02045 [Hahellaceae bacterium]|nr:hypothetical protein [Hahellaceae bacterium]MCP5168527.1 hypothetical protein [Hahellaceae bacterium]